MKTTTDAKPTSFEKLHGSFSGSLDIPQVSIIRSYAAFKCIMLYSLKFLLINPNIVKLCNKFTVGFILNTMT